MRHVSLLIAGSLLFLSYDARAQFETTIGADMAMKNLQNELLQRRLSDEQSTASQPGATLDYRPSMQRRRANVQRFIDSLRQTEPALHAELNRMMQSGDLIEVIAQGIRPYGLRADNLGDAYAFWWIHAWLAWAGDTSDQTPAQARAVADQAAAAMRATPNALAMDDAGKQDMAETLLLQGMLIGSGLEQIKADASAKPPWRMAMEQAGKAMGLDFAKMRLTLSGFVPADAGGNSPAAATPGRAEELPVAAARPTVGAAGSGPIDSALSNRLIDRVIFYQWGDLQFRPTALLKDGTAFDIDEASFEAEPPERARQLHPRARGRWQASGNSLILVDAEGRRSVRTIGEGVYRSFPGRQGDTLVGTYESVSGMQAGEMSMLNSGRITFFADGHFTSRRDFSAVGTGEYSGTSMAGGSSAASSGTYAISGHRIVLSFGDGRTQDLFFGFGSEGSPQREDRDMIFMGDTGWVLDDD